MATGAGFLKGLSDLVTARAERAKEQEIKTKEEERSNQAAIIKAGIESAYNDPTLSDDQREMRVQHGAESLKKLYPKDTHDLLDKWNGMLAKVHLARKGQSQSSQGMPPQGAPGGQEGASGQG